MDDLTALKDIITDIETGVNTNDVELATRHFTDDATAVTVTGAHVAGIGAIVEAHREAFAGVLRDQHARYELGPVRFLGPDVAVAHKRAWATDADGRPVDVGHAMVALYVFVRDGDRWKVAARQNTLVNQPTA
jgi:uncharacterized protein (TIGR02246 family)